MKTRATLLGLLALPFAGFAQGPTLTAANTTPVDGQTSNSFIASGFNPGGSGAAQTWDFSNLSYRPDETYIYDSCVGCKPGSTLRASYPSGGNATFQKLYKADATVLSLVGSDYTQYGPSGSYPTVTTVYSRQRDQLRYPMSFGTTFTNTWSALQTAYTRKDHGLGGTDTVTADAWGTIKTPAGTFTALRVRVGFLEYDTTKNSSGGGPGNPIATKSGVAYLWYDGVNKELVYRGEVYTSSSGSNNVIGVYYKTTPSGIGTPSGSAFSWTVAPNPATENQIKVILEAKSGAAVTLRLIDLLGRPVRTLAATNTGAPLVLETAGLPAGTYMLSLVANGQSQGVQRVTLVD